MSAFISVLHFAGCFVILAEALNKLERTKTYLPTVSWKRRVYVACIAVGWFLAAIGSAGSIFMMLVPHAAFHELQDMSVVMGFALLLVSVRLRDEGGALKDDASESMLNDHT